MAMQIGYGKGGWTCVTRSALPDHVVFARLARSEKGQPLRTSEIYLLGRDGAPIDATVLRSIPLSFVEAQVAEDFAVFSADSSVPGPDLQTAARFFQTTFGEIPGMELPPHWVRDSLWAQFDDAEELYPPPPPLQETPRPIKESLAARSTLAPPLAGRDKGDAFYESVAEVYRFLAPRTRAVAKTIAEANDANLSTVHRWIRVARARGFLGEASHGKVTV